MNGTVAPFRLRAVTALQHLAWLVWLGWFALAPVFAEWVHTTEKTLVVPLLVLGGSAATLLAARQLVPWRERSRIVTADDLPLLVLGVVWITAAACLDNAAAQRNALQITAVLALAYAFGKLAVALPQPDRPLRAIALPFAVGMTLFAVAEVALGGNWFYELLPGNPYYAPYRDLGRPVATQFNPAALATFLLATFALAVGAIAARHGLRIGLVVGLALMLLFVRSRAAFLGLGAGAIAATLVGAADTRVAMRRLALVVALLVAVVAVSSVLPPPYDQFGVWRVFGTGGMVAQDRQIRLDAALSMWRAAPWLGVGFDQFPLWFPHHTAHDARIAPLGSTPDNGWLALLAENGLCGLAAFGWFVGAPLVRAGRALRRTPDDMLLRAAFAGLVALLVNLVGYTFLFWTTPCALLGLLCGTVAGRSARRTP